MTDEAAPPHGQPYGARRATLGQRAMRAVKRRYHDNVVECMVVAFGGLGAVVGFIVGLVAYPPTAPVAAVELGIPAALVGALVGGVWRGVRLLRGSR